MVTDFLLAAREGCFLVQKREKVHIFKGNSCILNAKLPYLRPSANGQRMVSDVLTKPPLCDPLARRFGVRLSFS